MGGCSGVIVYGMVTGGLPFTTPDGGGDRSHLRQVIAKGFGRKQREALTMVTNDCRTFIQQLLEPSVESRMRVGDAARHRWFRKPGLRMKEHPLPTIEPTTLRDIYRQIAELTSHSLVEVVAQIKANPFGSVAGMFNIKTHQLLLRAVPGADMLWASVHDIRPPTPPDLKSSSRRELPPRKAPSPSIERPRLSVPNIKSSQRQEKSNPRVDTRPSKDYVIIHRPIHYQSLLRMVNTEDAGDGLKRLPSIDENSRNSNTRIARGSRLPTAKKAEEREARGERGERRLATCPPSVCEPKLHRRPHQHASENKGTEPSTRLLMQNSGATMKRSSLGNITSPHSSTNSHCKSDRALPFGWSMSKSIGREALHLQRLRRTGPTK